MMGVFWYLAACIGSTPADAVCWVQKFKSSQECVTVMRVQEALFPSIARPGTRYQAICHTTTKFV